MLDVQEPFDLTPIGVVHSEVRDRRLMPANGVPARIEVFPAYVDGLLLAEENSHLWLVGWFTDTDRERLQIIRPNYEPQRRRRGVFGLRSTTRPNPIALTVARLERRDRNWLSLDRLDFIDGTPILDIKRYTSSWECVFSARSSRDLHEDLEAVIDLDDFIHTAVIFHGRESGALVAGARLVQHACVTLQVRPKDPGFFVTLPANPAYGAAADAIQGITAATLGNGRLRVQEGSGFVLETAAGRVHATPTAWADLEIDSVKEIPIEALFTVEVG
jgi:tRNA-Thr(GGU) m(6)t(6)A37 methyltransferase TsaA